MNEKETIVYFRDNIFLSKSFYTGWKMIACARWIDVVGEEMANRYLSIQNTHTEFFKTTEHALLRSFVISICHVFEKRKDSESLSKLDQKKFNSFKNSHKQTIDYLLDLRNNMFAHKSKHKKELLFPAVKNLDIFMEDLEKFYNELSHIIENSSTSFNNAGETLKHDIEYLYMNIERGENVRKKDIDIKWLWEESNNKISNKI